MILEGQSLIHCYFSLVVQLVSLAKNLSLSAYIILQTSAVRDHMA